MANPLHLYQSLWAANIVLGRVDDLTEESIVISVTDNCVAGEHMSSYLYYVTLAFASHRTTMYPFPPKAFELLL